MRSSHKVKRANSIAIVSDGSCVLGLGNIGPEAGLPEIWPCEAAEAGAKIVATGRGDFPNQLKNSLVFPAMFRGVLDVRASTISC